MKEAIQVLPPSWCGNICRNSMSEKCLEHCALKRDCSCFEPRSDMGLSAMPRFPLEETRNMTREEKFTAVTVYLTKVVDYLNGIEEEPKPPMSRRIVPITKFTERKVVTTVAGILQSSLSGLEGLDVNKIDHQTSENPVPLSTTEIAISEGSE